MLTRVLQILYIVLACWGGALILREAAFLLIKGLTRSGVPEKSRELDLGLTCFFAVVSALLVGLYAFVAGLGWEMVCKL